MTTRNETPRSDARAYAAMPAASGQGDSWSGRGLGLRAQIVISLAVLMGVILGLLALGTHTLLPLVVDREVGDARLETARVLARSLARSAAVPGAARGEIRAALERSGVTGATVWDLRTGGSVSAEAPGTRPVAETVGPSFAIPRVHETRDGWVVVEPAPDRSASAAVRISAAGSGRRARSLEGLLLLYLGVSAVAVIVFGYISLTRLIVRPIERLTLASRRLGAGAADARTQPAGGRELIELGVAFNAMADEVTANRAAMEEKIESLERLNRELSIAQEQVIRSAKLASVGQLAAGIAHEIGNPLTVMLGFFEVLETVEPTAPEMRDYLARMRVEAERVNRIIRDLLDYARASPQTVEPISIGEVVDATVALLAPQRPFRNVEIQAAIPSDLPPVAANADRLRQVLVNLLMNAAEALGDRPGSVSITGGRAPLAGGRAGVRIAVEDTGPGVPEKISLTAFDPFVTTKSPGAGTGLGLSVCQGIVEGLGGTIRFENVPSGGARFEIVLPAVES